MRRFTFSALVLASLTLLPAGAFAQRYPGSRDPYYGRDAYGSRDPYYGRDRDAYYGRDYGNRGYRGGDPVDSAMRGLRQAASMSRYDGHERKHFDNAMRDLSRFQDRRRSGRFDRGALDSAISNMSDLARADQLHPRARDIIARDLSDLRNFRDSGDRYYDPYSGSGRGSRYPGW